jgi:hypothetical protein
MVCPFCGCDHFYARQLCYHDIIVDNDCNFISDEGIYDSEKPYGEFVCMECSAGFEDLNSMRVVNLPEDVLMKKEFRDKILELAYIMWQNHDTGNPTKYIDMALEVYNKHKHTAYTLDEQTVDSILYEMEERGF